MIALLPWWLRKRIYQARAARLQKDFIRERGKYPLIAIGWDRSSIVAFFKRGA